MTTAVHTAFELMGSAFGRSPISSFVMCSLFGNALELPQEACLDFPRTREWKAAAAHYRTLFIAYGIRWQDILLRILSGRLYIGPHVQDYLAGVDTEWEERLPRWTLGVQSVLEAGDAMPPFPTAVAVTSEGTDPSLRTTGQQGGSLNRKTLLWVPQRAVRPRGAGTPR